MMPITDDEKRAARFILSVALFYLIVSALSGCASDNWTTSDTIQELSWQALNVVDATQTANIATNPQVYESDPLTQMLTGSQPSSSDAYQVMATYAISHYLISRALPPKWRQRWFWVTIPTKAAIVLHNKNIGL